MITRPPRTICIGSLSSFVDFLPTSRGVFAWVCTTDAASIGLDNSWSDEINVGISIPLDVNGSDTVGAGSTSADYVQDNIIRMRRS